MGEAQADLTDAGIIAVREDLNLQAANWAQFPVNLKDIALRALISTANFAGLASGHNFPSGNFCPDIITRSLNVKLAPQRDVSINRISPKTWRR